MSSYERFPPIKPNHSMSWYQDTMADQDDALKEGLDLLESLRGALPPNKSIAIDKAKQLLISAAVLYNQARDTSMELPYDPAALADLLPADKKKLLGELCALVLQEQKNEHHP